MKRALVTGATGFIGRHALRPLLERGYEVHASYAREPGAGDGVSWHRANLLDPSERAALIGSVRPTHLLHFAWYAVPGRFWSAPENATWVDASVGLFRRFFEAGGKRAVGAGTCAEYDWSDGRLSEHSTPLAPATPYGGAKHATQLVTSALAQEIGADFAWGRIFFVYGPSEYPDRLVASVARALVNGEHAACSEGSQRRDFLYSEDVGSAFAALLHSGVGGPVNIGSGRAVAVRDLVVTIGRAAGRPELIELGKLPRNPGDPALIEADVRRLSEEVGWTPRVSLEDGIERTVKWWKEHA